MWKSILLIVMITVTFKIEAQEVLSPRVAEPQIKSMKASVAELRKGEPGPDLARALNVLGTLLYRVGEHSEATPLLIESVALWDKIGKPVEPGRVSAVVNLARAYSVDGKLDRAEALLVELRELLDKDSQQREPRYGTVLNNLSLVWEEKGELAKAEPLYKQAIEIFERAGTEFDRQRAAALNNLSALQLSRNANEEAERSARLSMKLLEQVVGPSDAETALSVHTLAMAMHATGRRDEAAELYNRSLRICESTLGGGHPSVAMIQTSLAALWMEQGYNNKAETLLVRSLATRERQLGLNHPETAITVAGLGTLRLRERRLSEAEELLARSVNVLRVSPGGVKAHMINALGNLAESEFLQGSYDKRKYAMAEKHFREVVTMNEKLLFLDDRKLTAVLDRLAESCAAQRKYRDAEAAEHRALTIRTASLGERHPDTVANLRRYTSLLKKH
jgi:tetratricopeptide (TPR) repeat protein